MMWSRGIGSRCGQLVGGEDSMALIDFRTRMHELLGRLTRLRPARGDAGTPAASPSAPAPGTADIRQALARWETDGGRPSEIGGDPSPPPHARNPRAPQ
jgi:hypothetical protein